MSGGSGLEHDRRALRGGVFFSVGGHRATRSRDDAAPPEGRATGSRVGTDTVCVPEPSQRLLGVREFHLRVRGVRGVRLRARGRRPRACSNHLGRAHLARVEAARRERESEMRARTRACAFSKARERRVSIGLVMDALASVPRAELKCGFRSSSKRRKSCSLFPTGLLLHVSAVRVFAHRRGRVRLQNRESTIVLDSSGSRDVASIVYPCRAVLRAQVTQPHATQET